MLPFNLQEIPGVSKAKILEKCWLALVALNGINPDLNRGHSVLATKCEVTTRLNLVSMEEVGHTVRDRLIPGIGNNLAASARYANQNSRVATGRKQFDTLKQGRLSAVVLADDQIDLGEPLKLKSLEAAIILDSYVGEHFLGRPCVGVCSLTLPEGGQHVEGGSLRGCRCPDKTWGNLWLPVDVFGDASVKAN